MSRVHIICEGQTEEMFVNEVLAPEFHKHQIYLIPSLIGKPGHKGGRFNYPRLIFDLRARLLRDPKCYCTTFFDFYRLPGDFPGKKEADQQTTSQARSECLLGNLMSQLASDLHDTCLSRFIPYVQMHEFEGLLFSDCEALALGLYRAGLANFFLKIRSQYESPEDINDGPTTSPSKRILSVYREYDKPTSGTLAAMSIGLSTMRQQCPIFDRWLSQLEEIE